MKNFKFGKRSKGKLFGDNTRPGVNEKLAKLAVLALSYSTIDFGISDGVRTTSEQQQMFRGGHSELDGVHKKSDHQYGLAIDLIPTVMSDGTRLDAYDISNPIVVTAWLEVYRSFMRASMKLGAALEFGVGYNIGGGRDYPHISLISSDVKRFTGLNKDILV